MGFFSNDTFFTAKEMRGLKPQDSIAFQKLLANKKIAAVLDQKVERIAVWKKMKEEAKKTQDGRLTRDGMRRVLGSLRRGKESSINVWGEAIPLAHEVFPERFVKRYMSEERDRDTKITQRFSPESSISLGSQKSEPKTDPKMSQFAPSAKYSPSASSRTARFSSPQKPLSSKVFPRLNF